MPLFARERTLIAFSVLKCDYSWADHWLFLGLQYNAGEGTFFRRKIGEEKMSRAGQI
jgi:hypothetical protein